MARIQLLEGLLENRDSKVSILVIERTDKEDVGCSNKTQLRSFLFQTVYQGEQLKIWAERTLLLQRWRRVIDGYPTFNASAYHGEHFNVHWLLSK